MTLRERANEKAIGDVVGYIRNMESLLKYHEGQSQERAVRIDELEKENAGLKAHIRNFEAEASA